MNILRVNDVEMPCEKVVQNGGERMDAHFFVEYPIIDALNVFHDGTTIKVTWEDGTEKDYSRFRILKSITYNIDGKLDVCYRMLSPLEQMIELHYGGIN